MFKTIFVEESVRSHNITQNFVNAFPKSEVKTLKEIGEVFGKVRKPYLQKRTDLNLFLGVKKGQLVKEAPSAYGLKGEPHYYYLHAYNCVYECQYCYLQGYFKSPDLVFFVNHEQIIKEIEKTINTHPKDKRLWFHSGEFSDSLALSHLTKELPLYWECFSKYQNAYLELRTKSTNIKEILKLPVRKNIITSFTLSPQRQTKTFDLKTPSLNLRLKAIANLADKNYPVGIHLDPIIYDDSFKEDYKQLLNDLGKILPNHLLAYISVGVVRFTKDVFREMKKNYPQSPLLTSEINKSFDGKIRYNRPMRLWILKSVSKIICENGYDKNKIYHCME